MSAKSGPAKTIPATLSTVMYHDIHGCIQEATTEYSTHVPLRGVVMTPNYFQCTLIFQYCRHIVEVQCTCIQIASFAGRKKRQETGTATRKGEMCNSLKYNQCFLCSAVFECCILIGDTIAVIKCPEDFCVRWMLSTHKHGCCLTYLQTGDFKLYFMGWARYTTTQTCTPH